MNINLLCKIFGHRWRLYSDYYYIDQFPYICIRYKIRKSKEEFIHI